VLAASFFLLWFLGETLYNWLAISALSLSPLPLFPRYSANQSGDEWPTHNSLLKVRDWLRSNGYKQVQRCAPKSAAASICGCRFFRMPVPSCAPGHVLPQPSGVISVCYVLTSMTAEGHRYVTDNLYIPFGGFYPESWLVERSRGGVPCPDW